MVSIARAMKHDPTEKSLLEAFDDCGRRISLTDLEKDLIKEVVLKLRNNSTPLSGDCVYISRATTIRCLRFRPVKGEVQNIIEFVHDN